MDILDNFVALTSEQGLLITEDLTFLNKPASEVSILLEMPSKPQV